MPKLTLVQEALEQFDRIEGQMLRAALKVLRYGNYGDVGALCTSIEVLRESLEYIERRANEKGVRQIDSYVADRLIRESAAAEGDGE